MNIELLCNKPWTILTVYTMHVTQLQFIRRRVQIYPPRPHRIPCHEGLSTLTLWLKFPPIVRCREMLTSPELLLQLCSSTQDNGAYYVPTIPAKRGWYTLGDYSCIKFEILTTKFREKWQPLGLLWLQLRPVMGCVIIIFLWLSTVSKHSQCPGNKVARIFSLSFGIL